MQPFFEPYNICTPLHRSNFKILARLGNRFTIFLANLGQHLADYLLTSAKFTRNFLYEYIFYAQIPYTEIPSYA